MKPLKKSVSVGEADFLAFKIGALWSEMKRQPAHFWLLCLYLSFEYVRPQSIYPVLDFMPWAKILLLATLTTCLMSKEPKFVKNPLTFTSAGFFLAALASSIFATYPDDSFERFVAFSNWLILYFVFIWTVTSKFRLYVVVLLLLFASLKMSQHGAKVWISRGMNFDVMGIAGPPGYFGNAADLGVQMLIFIALSLAFILGCRAHWGKIKKVFFYLFPITAVMTVIGAGERGTMLGLATMGLVTVLLGKHKFRKLFLIAIAGLVVFQVMPAEYKARFETIGTDGTSQARLRYWKRGLDMYQDHPLIGVGFNNWQRYYATHYPGESLRRDQQEVAHSTPITVLAEMGTLGFVFFYGMALVALITNIRTARIAKQTEAEPFWRHLAFGLNIGLFGFLAASCFVTQHEFPFLFVQASLSAALYNVVARKQVPVANERPVRSHPPVRGRLGWRR